MIKLKKLTFNMFYENSYVIWDDKSKSCAIIDPGCFGKSEKLELQNFIKAEELAVKYLINTHCHIDHIFGCKFVKTEFNPVYLAPEEDLPLLHNASFQAESVGINFNETILPDQFIKEQNSIELGDSRLTFLFTPGHTPGEYCIYLPDEKICFTGDVLFYDSVGRTDLWGGNYQTLLNSIKVKLLTLPEETIIYPGHGDHSTIKREKNNNPFLKDLV